jgi:hypothetical protein
MGQMGQIELGRGPWIIGLLDDSSKWRRSAEAPLLRASTRLGTINLDFCEIIGVSEGFLNR